MNSATAWGDPVTQHMYLLVIHEAVYYGTKLDRYLINPNQVRSYGLELWDNPFDKEKSLRTELEDYVDITMQTKGTKVYFETRSPTEVELRDFSKFQLTSRNEWNPATVSLNETTTNNRKDRPSMQIRKLKISSKIIDFEYLYASDNALLMHSIEPLMSYLKEQMIMRVPRNVAEVT